MRIVALALIGALWLTASAASQPHPPSDRLIVPGERIGRWTLEHRLEDFIKAYGFPTNDVLRQRPPLNPAQVQYQWRTEEAIIATVEESRLVRIGTYSPAFKTAEDISVQTPETRLIRILGKPDIIVPINERRARLLLYDALGLAVAINDDSAYMLGPYAISVFRKGTAHQLLAPKP